MSVNERLGFDPSLLPVTHILLLNSTIWAQSKQLNKTHIFPQGILKTKELPVALVPKEFAHYHQRGQVLFVTHEPDDQFDVYYPKYTATHTYYPPWILFGFLRPQNKLTIPASQFQSHADEEYEQGQLI
ncbi:MAG: hypothetical protein NTZ55_05010 [Candidatus Roizmanbacteria bacterium]|nr:hypothetical protein [Candidatus Roizmanbacteria bacterium]